MADTAPPTLHDVEHRDAIIHPSARVSAQAVVGSPGEWHDHPSRFPAVVCEKATIREFARVHAGCERQTVIGPHTLVMSGAHIGHDARIGAHCDIAPNVVIGGLVTVGDRVKIGLGAVVLPGKRIGDGAVIGAGSVVTKDIPAGETWAGNPARRLHRWDAAQRYAAGDVSV